jgi:hypothetical protein
MTTAQAVAKPRLAAERRFYTGMALVVLASTFLGFAPSYYLRAVMAPPHPLEPLTPLVFVHGLLFTAWVLLFVAQTWLVAGRQIALHRRLGGLSAWLLGAIIPVAVAVGIGGIHRPLTAPPGIPPLQWAAVPLLGIVGFSVLVVAALLARRDAPTHKRLMLCAMIALLDPSLGRLSPALGVDGPAALLIFLAFLAPLVVWDLVTLRRLHPATVVGSLVVIATAVGTLLVWETPAWLAIAGALAKI